MGASVSTETITVLHVNDGPAVGERVKLVLECEDDRLAVVGETTVNDGVGHLRADETECVDIDFDVPGVHGFEFLDAGRARLSRSRCSCSMAQETRTSPVKRSVEG